MYEDFRKDLDAFITPIINRRDELKKEIEIADKYNAKHLIIYQAKLEIDILSSIHRSLTYGAK